MIYVELKQGKKANENILEHVLDEFVFLFQIY